MTRPPIIDITHPLILKAGELFFLCDRSGDVEPEHERGLGLYYRDCRYLCRYALCLGGHPALVIMHGEEDGRVARFALTNQTTTIPADQGSATRIPHHALAITRDLSLDGEMSRLCDRLSLRNCTLATVAFDLELTIAAHFEDIFALRGSAPKARGQIAAPYCEDDRLMFRYDGADEVIRRLIVASSLPSRIRSSEEGANIAVPLRLDPQASAELILSLSVEEHPQKALRGSSRGPEESVGSRGRAERCTRVESDNVLFDAILEHALGDIRMLTVERDKGRFVAAGVPWYVALFGRDSLVPSLQYLAWRPELAADTVRLLAEWQGRCHAPAQREEPGKILHELRVGEMARCGDPIPQPTYGSVDSTIFFLIALASHERWAGNTSLFETLIDPVERALGWMANEGDADRDGYIEYDSGSEGPAANQGWKDSADAIVDTNGEPVRGRIALVEVQGYAYLAKRLIGELYARIGESARADRLAREADDLRLRFNRDFWMKREQYYCLALDGNGDQVASIASNPGQALWSGIVATERARSVADRLMAPDMFTGWGVRTLSEGARRYNPIGYHTGSVWPFDNSLIAAGFVRYGFDDHAARLVGAMIDAATWFDYLRLPEFFAGIARQGRCGPARCPRADPLQAWSAGALPYMLTSLLGLEPDGFVHRLRITRPLLPPQVERLELRDLRVGGASVDLRFERRGGATMSSVLRCHGKLEIEAQP